MHTAERRVPQNEVCALAPLASQQEKTADGQPEMLEHAHMVIDAKEIGNMGSEGGVQFNGVIGRVALTENVSQDLKELRVARMSVWALWG